MSIVLKGRNRRRKKHGRISRGYIDLFQFSPSRESRYNYPTLSESSISKISPYHDSPPMQSSALFMEKPVQVPLVDWNLCQGCGICVQNCPVAAIEIIAEKANINPQKCIRCKTCSTVCPHNAIIIV
jgi:ferredoxin